MTEISRYDMGSPAMGGSMEQSPDGDYVLFDHIKPYVDKVREIEQLFNQWSTRVYWDKADLREALREINDIIYPP